MCQYKYKINNGQNLKYIINRVLNIIIKNIVIFENILSIWIKEVLTCIVQSFPDAPKMGAGVSVFRKQTPVGSLSTLSPVCLPGSTVSRGERFETRNIENREATERGEKRGTVNRVVNIGNVG